MENKIQKLFKPMESPRIFGPNTFPSNCIKMIIKIKNKTPLLGLAIKTTRNNTDVLAKKRNDVCHTN